MRHHFSTVFERQDQARVVVRCIDCGNIEIASYTYWPQDYELEILQEQHRHEDADGN